MYHEPLLYDHNNATAWLEAKGTTLWGDWDITDLERRKVAANWFLNQIADYQQFVNANKHNGANTRFDVV